MVPPHVFYEGGLGQDSGRTAVMRTKLSRARTADYFDEMFSRSVFHGSETSLLLVSKRMVMRRSRSKDGHPGLTVEAKLTHALSMASASESGRLVPRISLFAASPCANP